jgi:uncharacterized protein YbaA (DUF1428 family)
MPYVDGFAPSSSGPATQRIAGMDMKDMPFDGKRMIYGGFKVMVEA